MFSFCEFSFGGKFVLKRKENLKNYAAMSWKRGKPVRNRVKIGKFSGTHRLDRLLDEILSRRQIVVGVVRVDFLADRLHGDLLEVRLRQNVLEQLLDVVVAGRSVFLASSRCLLRRLLQRLVIILGRFVFFRLVVFLLAGRSLSLLLRRRWSGALRSSFGILFLRR